MMDKSFTLGIVLILLRSTGQQIFSKPSVIDILPGNSERYALHYQSVYTLNVASTSTTVWVLVHVACEYSLLSLSLSSRFSFGQYANGTSVGLVAMHHSDDIVMYLKLTENCTSDLSDQCLITALAYNSTQPIPGACNLVHNLNIYPMIDVKVSPSGSARVQFSSANVGYAAGVKPPVCDTEKSEHLRLEYDVYAYFTARANSNIQKSCAFCNRSLCNTNSAYLNDIANIFSGKTHSYKIKTMANSDKGQYHLAAYKCASMMTYIVVRDPNLGTQSMYIPTTISMPESNHSPQAGLAYKVVAILLGIVGLFLCITGHRFYIFELFFVSGLFFCLLSLCIVEAGNMWTGIDGLDFGWIAVAGVIGGSSITALWHRCGNASMFSCLIGIVGGFCFSCITFITPLSNINIFEYRGTFIICFLCGCLIYMLALIVLSKMHRLCIISSALVGSCIVVASVGYGFWSCSIVGQFVFILIRKMATVPLLDATIVYPLYTLDCVLIGIWCGLFLLGIVSQYFLTRDRPPFPLTPRELAQLQPTMDIYQDDNVPTPDNQSISSGALSCESFDYDGDVSDEPPDYRELFPGRETAQLLPSSI